MYYTVLQLGAVYSKLESASQNHRVTFNLVETTGDAAATYRPFFNRIDIEKPVAQINANLVLHETVHIYNDYHYSWVSRDTEEAEAYTLTTLLGINGALSWLQRFEDKIRNHEGPATLQAYWNGMWALDTGLPHHAIPPMVEYRAGTGADVMLTEREFGFNISYDRLRVAYEALLAEQGYPPSLLATPAGLPRYIE